MSVDLLWGTLALFELARPLFFRPFKALDSAHTLMHPDLDSPTHSLLSFLLPPSWSEPNFLGPGLERGLWRPLGKMGVNLEFTDFVINLH